MYFDVKRARSTGHSMFVFSFDTREEYEQMLKDLRDLAEDFDESSDSHKSLLSVADILEKRYTEKYNDANPGHACSTLLWDNEIALGFTTLYLTSAALHEAVGRLFDTHDKTADLLSSTLDDLERVVSLDGDE